MSRRCADHGNGNGNGNEEVAIFDHDSKMDHGFVAGSTARVGYSLRPTWKEGTG
jgi:hypothetical protein